MAGDVLGDVPPQRLGVLLDVASGAGLFVPAQPAPFEVFDFGLGGHPVGELAQDPFHHGQMLSVVMSLQKQEHPKLNLVVSEGILFG